MTVSTTTVLNLSQNPIPIDAVEIITATVVGSTPTGSVAFYDGQTLLGSSTLSSGAAEFSFSLTTVGVHEISAVYSGDSNNQFSYSADVPLTAISLSGGGDISLYLSLFTSEYQS